MCLEQDKAIQKVVCSIASWFSSTYTRHGAEDVLGDLIPGDGGKHCQCEVTPGAGFDWPIRSRQAQTSIGD